MLRLHWLVLHAKRTAVHAGCAQRQTPAALSATDAHKSKHQPPHPHQHLLKIKIRIIENETCTPTVTGMQATHDSEGRAVPLTQERKASAKTFAKSDFHDTGSADIWRKYYTQARRATKSTVHGLFVSSLSYACSHGIQSVACWPGRLLHERLLAVACMNGLPQAPAHAVLFGSAVSTLSCCAVAQLH